MIKWLLNLIKGEKRRKKAKIEIEALKKEILEDPKFRDEILRELEYRTGRRDLLKAGVLGLLGLGVGKTIGVTNAINNNYNTLNTNSMNILSSKCIDAVIWVDKRGYTHAEDKNGLTYSGMDATKIIQQVIDDENDIIFINGNIKINKKITLKTGKTILGFGKYLYNINKMCGSAIYSNFSGELIECQKDTSIFGLSLVNKNENGIAIKITDMHVKIGFNDIFSKKYGIIAKYENVTYRPYTRPEAFIFNNRITGEGLQNSIGIWCYNVTDTEITNNIIRGFETGIKLDKGGNIVTGNHIYRYPAKSYARAINITHSDQLIIGNVIDNPSSEGVLVDGDLENIIIKDNFMRITCTGVGIRVSRNTVGWMVRMILEGNIIITHSNPNPAVKIEKIARISAGSKILNAVYGFNKGSNNTVQTGVAIIPKGETSIKVKHNLPIVNPPPVILVTGYNKETKSCWITNITNTEFTINTANPVSVDRVVKWRAEVYE